MVLLGIGPRFIVELHRARTHLPKLGTRQSPTATNGDGPSIADCLAKGNLGALPPPLTAICADIPKLSFNWRLQRVCRVSPAWAMHLLCGQSCFAPRSRDRSNASIPPSRCVLSVSPESSTTAWRDPSQPKRIRGMSFEGHSVDATTSSLRPSQEQRLVIFGNRRQVDRREMLSFQRTSYMSRRSLSQAPRLPVLRWSLATQEIPMPSVRACRGVSATLRSQPARQLLQRSLRRPRPMQDPQHTGLGSQCLNSPAHTRRCQRFTECLATTGE